MKHLFLLIGLLFTLLQGAQAQSDSTFYRTKKTGDWNDMSTWQIKDAGNWRDLRNRNEMPTETEYNLLGGNLNQSYYNKKITIQKGHKVISNMPITIGGELAGEKGSTLEIKGTLEVKRDNRAAITTDKGCLRIYQESQLIVTGRLLVHGNLELSGNLTTGDVKEGAYVGVKGNISGSYITKNTIANNGVIRYGGGLIGPPRSTGGDIRWSSDPLPIELKSFVASAKDGIVSFAWVTASEKNNDYFTIEQSTDLKNWEVIHRQQGAGNSFSELSYKAEKKLKGIGIFYFRLKQTDYDGQFSYSKIVSLSNNTLNEEVPSAFSESGEIVIRNTYEHLQVFNTQGRLLGTYSQTYRLNDLPKGILIFVFDKKHKQKIVNF